MRRFRIDVNRDVCVGDGLCRETAPETFQIDTEGKVAVLNPEGDAAEYIKSAAQKCRLEAITLFDADTGERVWPRWRE